MVSRGPSTVVLLAVTGSPVNILILMDPDHDLGVSFELSFIESSRIGCGPVQVISFARMSINPIHSKARLRVALLALLQLLGIDGLSIKI